VNSALPITIASSSVAGGEAFGSFANPLVNGNSQFAALYTLQLSTNDTPQESPTETIAENEPLLNFSMPAQAQMPASKAGGKKQLPDANLPNTAQISAGTLGVAVALVPTIATQIVRTSSLESAESEAKAASEIGPAPGTANGFNNSISGVEPSTSSPTPTSRTISPVDSVVSQAITRSSSSGAGKIVNSQNDSSQNSAATVPGMIRSAGTPLASGSFEQSRAQSVDDPTMQVEAQAGIQSTVLINGSGQIASVPETIGLPKASAELFLSQPATACIPRLSPGPAVSAQSNFSESQLNNPASSARTESLPGQLSASQFSVSTEATPANEETQSDCDSGDANETQLAVDVFSEPASETPSLSEAAQNKPQQSASAAKTASASSSTSPTLATVKIPEVIIAGASSVENLSNPASSTSANELASDLPIAKVSTPALRANSPGGIQISSTPNSTENKDVSADSNAVKAANSAGQISDKTTSSQPPQTAPAKAAPGKADSDSGNSSASPTPNTNTTAAAPPTPAPIATASATAVVARPDGNPQTSPTTLPSGADNSRNLSAGQASIPAPTDSPTLHTGPVQMAQIVNQAAQSEMRVELNTSAFGSVEVRTTVRANDVGVLIGSEKGDLRSLLANELPGIASNLQQQNLRLNQVNFHQGFASGNQMSSGGGGSQSRSFAARTGGTTAPVPMDINSAESGEAMETYVPQNTSGKLSILA
jgi:trimeric autotransporter adhesin